MSTAAELIAKIKVNGFSEYQSAMTNAERALQRFSSTAASTGQALMRHLLSPMNAVLGVAGGGGLLELTKEAVSQAAKIERLKMTYAALSGSLDTAGKKMAFLNQFAKTSITHFDDLAEAGTILEASGLKMERFLPTINNIAGAFGGTSDQVMELSEAISRMAGGSMGEAERVFRRFGITMADFAAQGLKMGHGGQIHGDAAQLLDALEKVAQKKFGNIGTLMADTMTVRFSNLGDAWHKMLDSFGRGWFPFIEKVVGSLTPFMEFLTQSGVLEGIAKHFGSVLGNLAGITDDDSIPRFLSYVAALLENMPQMMQTVGGHIKGFLETASDAFVEFLNTGKNAMLMTLNNMKHMVEGIVNTIHKGIFTLKAIVAGPFALNMKPPKPFTGGKDFDMDDFKSPADMLSRFIPWLTGGMGDNIGKRADDIFNQFKQSQKGAQADGASGSPGMFNDNYMAQIAQNTAKTAQSTAHMAELKRFALGGGDLGQMGVTPAEMYGMRGNGHVDVRAGNKHLDAYFQELLAQYELQRARQRGPMDRYIRG